jgi:hypothetical protein
MGKEEKFDLCVCPYPVKGIFGLASQKYLCKICGLPLPKELQGNNGKPVEPEPQKPEEPKPIQMMIDMSTDGKMTVHFPFLNDKCATYGFLKIAEKTLDKHYAYLEQSKIITGRNNFRNFIRGRH